MSEPPAEVDVLVVGAGPTGLSAAIAARAHGLTVRVVDRSVGRTEHSKALVLHSRTMEALDDLGCLAPILSSGRRFRALNIQHRDASIARIAFDQLDWHDAPYPMWFTIPQSSTERCLEEHLTSLGTIVERESNVRELEPSETSVGVTIERPDGGAGRCRASWVVGCDGARSEVRKMLGVALHGEASDEVFVLADVDLDSTLTDAEGYNILAPEGVLLIVPMDTPGRVRIIAHMPELRPDDTPVIDVAMLQRLLDARCGVKTRISSLGWTSHFSPKHLMAERYRAGRVFLAGDAAHLHSPVGGQGLNTGVQDAYNLAWKLALAHRGLASPALLDSYETERRTVAEEMVRAVRRATRLLTLRGSIAQAARNRVARAMLSLSGVKNRMGRNVGMLHVRYPQSAAVNGARWPSPQGPRPGERAPLLASVPELANALRGTAHTLLCFDGLRGAWSESAARAMREVAHGAAGELVRVVRVRGASNEATPGRDDVDDPGRAIHRAYGAAQPRAVWVRPDKYVGYCGDPSTADALARFLRGMFATASNAPEN